MNFPICIAIDNAYGKINEISFKAKYHSPLFEILFFASEFKVNVIS